VTVAAAIFDLDGTLVCLPVNYELLFDEFKRIMHVNVARPLVDTLARIDGKTREEVFAAWDKAELSVARNSTICNEGGKLYNRRNDKPHAVVTLQGNKNAVMSSVKFGFKFDVIITREASIFD
jgi:hypothetical protein